MSHGSGIVSHTAKMEVTHSGFGSKAVNLEK